MALQFSTAARNAILDAIESAAGTAAKLLIYTGSLPANCAAADGGSVLVTFDLASDWAAAASSGSKNFNNTPLSTTASGTGTAGHWRLLDSAGTTCHMQGTLTATGGGGDMTIDNTSVATGQTVNVTSFTLTAPGA